MGTLSPSLLLLSATSADCQQWWRSTNLISPPSPQDGAWEPKPSLATKRVKAGASKALVKKSTG
ncbi:UNVERIFIED_CONTAM: hypothetical protein Sradi_4853200 [Sesamum radiatum]|uniref:Secreted protein n=1 Tax=Sesamum radiatum TaxID=300843 RepID=A0AAW2N0L9_SESRA